MNKLTPKSLRILTKAKVDSLEGKTKQTNRQQEPVSWPGNFVLYSSLSNVPSQTNFISLTTSKRQLHCYFTQCHGFSVCFETIYVFFPLQFPNPRYIALVTALLWTPSWWLRTHLGQVKWWDHTRAETPLCHLNSLTRHNVKGKSIKNFKKSRYMCMYG